MGRLLMAWAWRLLLPLGLVAGLAAPFSPLPPQRGNIGRERVRLDPPQHVQTTDDRLCVHTRVTDEVDEGKIQETFRMVREMGAPWVVEYLPWAYVETAPDRYDWGHPDRILRHIQNQGLRPLIRLGFVPDWLRPPKDERYTNANYLTPRAQAEFIEYVGDFARRYRGRLGGVIIWNEPNLNLEWSRDGADPAAYTDLLRRAYEAAKAADPDLLVLGGALAPTNEPPRGAGGWNDLDYLNEMYKAGAAPYFDALAAHVYGFTAPPQADPGPEALNFRRLELLHAVMQKHGDGDKPIYITEGGWNDHPRWIHAVRPGQRIAYTLEAYAFTRQNYPWLKTLCWWAFRYPAPTNSYPDYFTFLSAQFDPKPIYEVLQAYGRGWPYPDWWLAP